jgi:two-component system, chemotaxis family, protein-glutamate methylesterase/glutaminase
MPEMDGLTALSLIMARGFIPVVMVSSLTEKGAIATFEALALGAVDYVTKPDGTISLSLNKIADELLAKVRAALHASPNRATPQHGAYRPPPLAFNTSSAEKTTPSFRSSTTSNTLANRISTPASSAVRPVTTPSPNKSFGLVLIGVSTGGPRTLESILPQLPADFPWPILVAQHMPATFTGPFSRRLDGLCPLTVQELSTPTPLVPGNIYVARGNADMVISMRNNVPTALPRPESPNHYWHPSADVLVESAMQHLAPKDLIGVLLTGMGYDGAESMAKLKEKGGKTIAESEESAVIFGMPCELIKRKGATMILNANQIASQLIRWANR